MKARECWNILLSKAQRQLQDAQAGLARAQQTHQSLEQSLGARVDGDLLRPPGVIGNELQHSRGE